MSKRGLTILAVILGLLFLGSLIWGITRTNTLTAEKDAASEEAEQLEILRDKLAAEVDSLSVAYESAVADNESLQGELAAAQKTAQAALYDMRRAQKSRRNDNEVAYQMRVQIEDLLNARANLETRIAEVEEENAELRKTNLTLRQDLSTAKTEAYNQTKKVENLETMSRTMEKQINEMTLGAFRASGMQVDMYRGRNGNKLTSDASRVKRMTVSFDLTGVPDKYLGVRPIYLVMTDQSGTPVRSENPVRAKAIVNGAAMDLIALEGRDVALEKNQRLSFTHEFSDKLAAGAYRAQIFTDIGQLGAATVNLR